MLQISWLYRWPSFIYYLIPPAAFLYVKTIARDEEYLRKWDYLHFLPGALHFLELIPYHLQPLHVKQDIVTQALADQSLIYAFNEGLLPAYWHHILRSLLGFVYGLAMFSNVFKIKQMGKSKAGIPISTIRWLFVFSGMILSTSIVVVTASLLKVYFDISVFQFYTLGVCIIFMFSLYYMYFHPEILYGVPRITGGISNKMLSTRLSPTMPSNENQVEPANSQIDIVPSFGSPMEYKTSSLVAKSDFSYLRHYQPKLEEYLEERKPFLQGGYSIRDMSEDTGIPQHHLSALLNKIYGARFNDFVNEYRIEFLAQKIATGEYQNLSMDGIAEQAGFGSRSTLFNSIKKLKGVSPTDFFNMRKTQTP